MATSFWVQNFIHENPLTWNLKINFIFSIHTPARQKGVPEQLYEGCVYNVTNHMNQLVKDGRAKEECVQEQKVYLRAS